MIPSMAGSRTYVGPAYYDSQQPVTSFQSYVMLPIQSEVAGSIVGLIMGLIAPASTGKETLVTLATKDAI